MAEQKLQTVEQHAMIGATLLEAFRMKGVPLTFVVGCGAKKFVQLASHLGATRTEALVIFERFCTIAQKEEDDMRASGGSLTGTKLAERRLCVECQKVLLDPEVAQFGDRCTYHAAKNAAS